MRILRFTLFMFLPCLAFPQELATLAGAVIDGNGKGVPGAALKLVDLRSNQVHESASTRSGTFMFEPLIPSEYSLEVSKEGMGSQKLEKLTLNARDRRSLRVRLQKEAKTGPPTVIDAAAVTDFDAASATAVDQDNARNLPLRTRDEKTLLLMAPGVVIAGDGQAYSNGVNTRANYLTLDGIALTAGPTDLEVMKEVRVQTSGFELVLGRTPGIQLAMSSQSGSNAFHGSVYEYFSNGRLSASEWFANSQGQPSQEMRYNQFGGVVGGPILHNRTYFLASYEGLRLRGPETGLAAVPDAQTRKQASVALKPYLDAFPIPNGRPLGGGAALFAGAYSNPLNTDSASVRIDHTIGSRHRAFFQYFYAPSDSEFRGGELLTPNVYTQSTSKTQSFTGALISTLTPGATNDLRVNYTSSKYELASSMDTFGGAVPLTDKQMFPAGTSSADGEYRLNVMGLSGYAHALRDNSRQQQYQVADTVTMATGPVSYKIGGDFRVLTPTLDYKRYSQTQVFSGLSGAAGALLSGTATHSLVASSSPQAKPMMVNTSLFLQSTARISRGSTLTYGARWDVNPAPRARSGPKTLALCDQNLGNCELTTQLGLYDTPWASVAPRFGLTSLLRDRPGKELVLRVGMGAFYDTGNSLSLSSFYGSPYVNNKVLITPVFPLSASDAAPPATPIAKPYGMVSVARRNLHPGVVYHLDLTLERSFGRNQVLSAGYQGTRGRNLLRTGTTREDRDSYVVQRLATDDASSDYHAMHVEYRRRLSAGLQAQVAYAYGHVIDTATVETVRWGGFGTLFTAPRGNSDFDVRHSLSVMGSYQLPQAKTGALKMIFSDWWTDFAAMARTGLPVEVQGVSPVPGASDGTGTTAPAGLFSLVRPNQTGSNAWINDAAAPGGQRLNPAAFTMPADYRQGSLGRNYICGFPMAQIDFSLRRMIPIRDRMALSFMAQALNVLNHPNFANPSRYEGANPTGPYFGVATRTLNGGAGGNSFFGLGGPRTFQIAFRLQF